MRINQNIMAFNAYRNLSATNQGLAKSLEKLSSGYRINRAADDSSGLVISQNLRAQVSGLRQATRNAQDGVSVVQTAEGALSEAHSMLNRMRDLIIQAANTATNDSVARQAAQNEIDQLRHEIDRIGLTTSFGAQKLLDGTFGAQPARTATNTGTVGATGLTGGGTITLVIDSGQASLSITITPTVAQYVTAASYQTELQGQVSAAIGAATSSAAWNDAVTVAVRDLGGGVWQVELERASTDDNTKLTVAASTVSGVAAGSSSVSNTGGGVFQVGANVTTTEQIKVSIDDVRITGGTDGAFTSLAYVDAVTPANHTASQLLIDGAINAISDVRGKLGAAQNRFESTISNLQVTTENLTASESRIRDTDMALEMVTFTRNQILMQAGTAMLAQANAAPQSILRLLQG